MKHAAVQTQRGFTLIELSVVLFIIAIVIGMSADMGISVMATAHLTATQKKMKTISDALMQFRTATDRLPCPGNLTLAPGSADYGLEAGADASSSIAAGTGVCTGTGMLPVANHTAAGATNTGATGAEGALPAVTLGLSPDFMLDGWGNKFRYAVDIAYTAKGVFATAPVGCTNGAITVNDSNANARSKASIYALISHSSNGHGAYTPSGATVNAGSSSADELTNCHCTSAGAYNSAYAPNYVQKLPQYDSGESGVAAYYFDDLVSYRERWQMRTDWDKVGGCQVIYVADCGGNRVEEFNASGTYIGQIGGCSSGACASSSSNGQFNCPQGVTIDSSGNIWVVDYNNNRIEKFNGSGYVSTFTDSRLSNPESMAFDTAGNFWVAQINSTYAGLKYTSAGSFIMGISGAGGGEPNLFEPTSVATDSSNNVYFGGYNQSEVQQYNSSGTYLTESSSGKISATLASSGNVWVTTQSGTVLELSSTLTSLGTTFGSFTYPTGITTDSSGNVWVVDSNGNKVYEFTSSGSSVQSFGSSGTGNGQFQNSGSNNAGIAIGGR